MANHLTGPHDSEPDGAAVVAAFRRRLQQAETRSKAVPPAEGNIVQLPVIASPVQIRLDDDERSGSRIAAIRDMTRKAANVTELPVKLAPAAKAAADSVMRAPAQIPDFISWIIGKNETSLFGEDRPVAMPAPAKPHLAPALAMATMGDPSLPAGPQAETDRAEAEAEQPVPALVRYSPRDFTPTASYESPLLRHEAPRIGLASRFFLYAVAIGIGAFIAALGLSFLMNGALR